MSQLTEKQPFWITHGLPAPNSIISQEAFDALPEVPFHMEWHNGVVIYPHWSENTMSPAPRSIHQRLVGRLHLLLAKHIPHGDVLLAPMDVKLGGRTIQPDVFWVAADGDCVDHDTYYLGAPDLVVEVLSPGNSAHDRVEKYNLYEAHGVGEYWIADADEQYIEVYTRQGQRFVRVGAFTAKQTFHSRILSQEIALASLFKD